MDTAARFDAWNKAVGGGWMSPDEARQRENMTPVPGGDTPYLQQQQYSLAALAKRDRDDPFSKPTPAAAPAADNAQPEAADANAGADTNADTADDATKSIYLLGLQSVFKEQLYATR